MSFYLRVFIKLYLKENKYMKKQISIISLIILTILTSCGTKKSISKSSLENNIIRQIDDSTNINTSSNTITQTNDSTEIIIQELIEETIIDTLNHQTIQRTTKRKATIMKSGNTKIEHSEESDTTHNKHKQIQEKKKEDNKSTNIRQYPIRKYLSIISIMILLVVIYKFIDNRRQ